MEEARKYAALMDAMSDAMTDAVTHEMDSAANRRLRGLAIHMAVFLVVTIGMGIVNFMHAPGEWWFILPMMMWGAPLALHAAYAMGLFKAIR